MAAARLRANKRQYVSLVLGIFLAIFLVTTLFLAVQGFLLAQLQKTEDKVGKLDAFLLDCPEITDEALTDMGMFTDIGHVYVTGKIDGSTAYIGYYDDLASEQMNRRLREGRMPETSGEIAVEYNTLLSLDIEKQWQIGDTLTLNVLPVDGVAESKSYTLVGILQNQSNLLDTENIIHSSKEFVNRFPAILLTDQKPNFAICDEKVLRLPICRSVSGGTHIWTLLQRKTAHRPDKQNLQPGRTGDLDTYPRSSTDCRYRLQRYLYCSMATVIRFVPAATAQQTGNTCVSVTAADSISVGNCLTMQK